MENSETGPTIFLKLAQIEVQGYSGALSDLEENLSTSFRAMIFQKWTVSRISGGLDAQCHCLSGAPRRRGSLTRGKGLSLTCHFLHAMQRKTILRTGMSYLILQVLYRYIFTRIKWSFDKWLAMLQKQWQGGKERSEVRIKLGEVMTPARVRGRTRSK